MKTFYIAIALLGLWDYSAFAKLETGSTLDAQRADRQNRDYMARDAYQVALHEFQRGNCSERLIVQVSNSYGGISESFFASFSSLVDHTRSLIRNILGRSVAGYGDSVTIYDEQKRSATIEITAFNDQDFSKIYLALGGRVPVVESEGKIKFNSFVTVVVKLR